MKRRSTKRLSFLLAGVVASLSFGQLPNSSAWRSYDLPFHALNLISIGQELWICGPREQIAVSDDSGVHWRLVHEQSEGAVLLSIDFASEDFGYAGGTNGTVLLTEDGGKTWISRHVNDEPVYQLSFSDPQNGIARSQSGLFITANGGTDWTKVSLPQEADDAKKFRYSFALAVLDAKNMAVLLKEGNAEYYGDQLFITQDGGKTWIQHDFPHSVIHSFYRVEHSYRAVGIEVVDREHRGGHSVPLALSSKNGTDWTHVSAALNVCQLHGCALCNHSGCLAGEGTLAQVFSDPVSLSVFSVESALSSTWAATSSKVCFLQPRNIGCTDLIPADKPKEASTTARPPALAPPPIGPPVPSSGPRCLYCSLDPVFVDAKAAGTFKVPITIDISPDGTVTSVDAAKAPTPQIAARVQQEAMSWIFEPLKKDGKPAGVRLTTSIQIRVVHPQ